MDQTIALIKQAHEGDVKAREQVINENLGLIWCVVKRFTGRGTPPEDLFQIGSIGLLKAVDKFNFSFDVKFSTYAVPMITGEIKRYLRDDGMVKVSRSLKELAIKAYSLMQDRKEKCLKEYTIGELAEILEVEKEELAMAMESCSQVESLNKPITQGDGSQVTLLDKVEKSENKEEEILNKIMINKAMEKLETQEQEIISLRYYMNMTQTEIGHKLGISQVQVSRLEKKILKKMRSHM